MVMELLREATEPLSVETVAQQVGVHVNTARFHLEALVGSGLAKRESEVRSQPGRRRVLYSGAETSHVAEPLHGYRLLSTILTAAIVAHYPDASAQMYQVGVEWGRYLTNRPAPFEVVNEADIQSRILDKLESLGFVPEYSPEPEPQLRVKHCPFMDSARNAPDVVCQLHCGIINGSLEVLGCTRRIESMEINLDGYVCTGRLVEVTDAVPTQVVLSDSKASMDAEPGVSVSA